MIWVEGKLKHRNFINNYGQTVYVTEIESESIIDLHAQ